MHLSPKPWAKGDINYVKVTLPGPASDIAAGNLDFNIAVWVITPKAKSATDRSW